MASSLMDRVWTKEGLRVVLKGPGLKRSGKKFSLAQPFARIGRFPYLDLPIDDPEISRWHVYLQRFPEGVFFVDLGSRLGLVHRGVACRDGWLDPGEPLEVGDFSLQVAETGGAASSPRGNPLARIEADKDDLLPVTLTFLTRDGNSIDHRLKRRLTLMGRSKPSNVRIADPSIARAHLAFYRTQTEAWIVNLAAASAFHDGQPLTSARLSDEDAFLVGDLTIVARVGSRAAERSNRAADSGALLLDALEPTELEEGVAPENTWDSDQAVTAPGANGTVVPDPAGPNGHEAGFVVESARLDARGIEEFFAEPRIVIGPPDIHLARLDEDAGDGETAPLAQSVAEFRVVTPDSADPALTATLPAEKNGHPLAEPASPEADASPPVDEQLRRESTRLFEENLRLAEQQTESQRKLDELQVKLGELETQIEARAARIAELSEAARVLTVDRDRERDGSRQRDEEIERLTGELAAARDGLARLEAETRERERALAEQTNRSESAAANLAERDALIAKMRGNQFKAAALIRQRNRQLEQIRAELAERTQERDELATICREWKEAAQAGHERERELAEAARVSAAALADLQGRLLGRDQECLEYQARLAQITSERETSATASAALRIAELERLFAEATRRGEHEHQRLVEELAASQAELAAMSREVSNLTGALRESNSLAGNPLGQESISAPAEPAPFEPSPAAPYDGAGPAGSGPVDAQKDSPATSQSTQTTKSSDAHDMPVVTDVSGAPGLSAGGAGLASTATGAAETGPGASARPTPSKVAATLLDRAEGINQARQSLINVGWIALSLLSLITLAFGLFWIMLP